MGDDELDRIYRMDRIEGRHGGRLARLRRGGKGTLWEDVYSPLSPAATSPLAEGGKNSCGAKLKANLDYKL